MRLVHRINSEFDVANKYVTTHLQRQLTGNWWLRRNIYNKKAYHWDQFHKICFYPFKQGGLSYNQRNQSAFTHSKRVSRTSHASFFQALALMFLFILFWPFDVCSPVVHTISPFHSSFYSFFFFYFFEHIRTWRWTWYIERYVICSKYFVFLFTDFFSNTLNFETARKNIEFIIYIRSPGAYSAWCP